MSAFRAVHIRIITEVEALDGRDTAETFRPTKKSHWKKASEYLRQNTTHFIHSLTKHLEKS